MELSSSSGRGNLSSRRRTQSAVQQPVSQAETPRVQNGSVSASLQEHPSWFREFYMAFRAASAHCFLFWGEVRGVTPWGVRFLEYLQRMLHTEKRSIVICYHRDRGIFFPFETTKEAALNLLGPDWRPPAEETDPYSSAINSLMGPQGDVFSSARTPAQAMAVLEHLMRLDSELVQDKLAIIIDGMDLICPATDKAVMSEQRLGLLAKLTNWGNDKQLMRQNNPIIVLAPRLQEVHQDLRTNGSGYKVIEVPLPDEQTRLTYVHWYLDTYRKDAPIPLVDMSQQDLARNTAGLSLREIENILLSGALLAHDEQQNGSVSGGVSRLLVKGRKDEIIRQHYGETIVFLDPLPGGFGALGGMTRLIEWMREEVLLPLQQGRIQDVPKGILLPGPPGVGKTLFVEAAAAEFGYNAIALRMASILGGVVGTSERNLQEVFEVARRMAPTFLFIDEIDQTDLSQRGSGRAGSPVAANLFGALLQFLSDETLRGRVIFLAATNHPESLDPALRRPGRFDVTYPVLCPNEEERLSILAVQARMQGVELYEAASRALARETEEYSPADLAALVKEVRYLARRDGSPLVQETHAWQALDNIRPSSLNTVRAYTQRALESCNNLRFLPPEVAERERNRRTRERQNQRQADIEREAGLTPRLPRDL